MRPREFWRWFNEERDKRGLSFRAVEKVGGLAHGAIAKRERAELPPTYNVCVAIARAFQMPVDDVLRKAGLLPSIPDDDPRIREMLYYFEQLPDELQDYLLMTAKALAAQHAEETEKEKP